MSDEKPEGNEPEEPNGADAAEQATPSESENEAQNGAENEGDELFVEDILAAAEAECPYARMARANAGLEIVLVEPPASETY